MSSIWAETHRREEEFPLRKGATAHDLLKIIYQCAELPLPVRMRAAIAAIPFETPKLSAAAQITENDFATLLDRRIRHYEEMKMIEHQRPSEATAVEVKSPMSTAERRLRRI